MPFIRGQIGLESYGYGDAGYRDAAAGLVEWSKKFSQRGFKKYRDQGYSLDVSKSDGVWWVVLNPPGVSRYR